MNEMEHGGTVAIGFPEIAWNRVSKLEWSQPRRLSRSWELKADGELAALMTWRGPWTRGFTARLGPRDWLVREPLFGPMSIARLGSDASEVCVKPRWFGGAVFRREAGDDLLWRRESWVRRTFVLANAEGFPLVRVSGRREFLRIAATVELEEAARGLRDLEALILLGWARVLASVRRHRH